MKLIQSILTKNPCYTAGRKITVKGLMLHSVGCPQPSAQAFIRNWNSASYDRACVHGFIDANDGTAYQTLPWNHRGWHGGGSSNNTHIGVEMCEPSCIKYTGGATFTCSNKAAAQAAAKRTYDTAVELFAMLCQQFSLDPLGDGVIVSHKEGRARGIASNHGDPEHLWTQLGLPYTMDTFRAAVKTTIAKSGQHVTPDTAPQETADLTVGDTVEFTSAATQYNPAGAGIPSWVKTGYTHIITQTTSNGKTVIKGGERCVLLGKKTNRVTGKTEAGINTWVSEKNLQKIGAAPAEKFSPYLVKVTVDNLAIRKGPSTGYAATGSIKDHGVYTIVLEDASAKWGKLKSGVGWICLSDTKKV